ncbi:MAG: alpha/beta hydrolase [Proteobacteria bacterium]|nr:alpha/beta hydrolase [Pseudomonadota bacterium]
MQTALVNGYQMTFAELGAGVPLVLVHGSTCDLRAWTEQMDAFAARYRTFALSLRACWPDRWESAESRYSVAQHIRDVATFIAYRGAGPVHLLGLSRGGYIAFRIAREYPHLVRTLVLAEPGGAIDPELEAELPAGPPPIAVGPLFAAAVERIERNAADEGLGLMFDALGGAGYWGGLSDATRQMLRDNARTLIPQLAEQRIPYARTDAARIRVPTLLLGGERSPAGFHRTLDALQAALPSAARGVVPAASHLSNIDNPAAFNATVLAFLEGR